MSDDEYAERAADHAADLRSVVGEERATLTTSSAPGSVTPSVGDPSSGPEPWSSTLWRAAKAAVLGGAGFYSMMRLMDGNATIGGGVFMGAWVAAMTVSASRKGSMIPSAPALILGGVTVGGALIASAVAVVSGQSLGEVAGVAGMGLFLGSVLLAMGFRSRRAERELESGQREARVAPVLISRAELARRMETLQAATHAETRRFMNRFGAAITAFVGLFGLGAVSGVADAIPEWAWMIAFFGFWGTIGGTMVWASKRLRADALRYGLICSACDRPYASTFGNMRLMKNITEIGRCPQCGVRIVSEDAP
jgi:DNA-directed RNA polymerase subunit RPC12/RpoP